MSARALQLVPAAPSLSLYQLVADVDNIAALVDALDQDGELTPDLVEQLQRDLIAAIAGTKQKVDRTAGVLASFEMAEASANTEIARLEKRAARFKRMKASLDSYVLSILDASKLDKLDGETSTLARRKNPPSVVVDDEAAVPTDFLRWPEPRPDPPPAPDKALIKKALAGGADVAGCRLVATARLVRS